MVHGAVLPRSHLSFICAGKTLKFPFHVGQEDTFVTCQPQLWLYVDKRSSDARSRRPWKYVVLDSERAPSQIFSSDKEIMKIKSYPKLSKNSINEILWAEPEPRIWPNGCICSALHPCVARFPLPAQSGLQIGRLVPIQAEEFYLLFNMLRFCHISSTNPLLPHWSPFGDFGPQEEEEEG